MLDRSCEVLGITTEASVHEVKQAYRTLAVTMHPDAGGDVALFTALNDAYQEVLAYAMNAPCPSCIDGYVSHVSASFKVSKVPCTVCMGTGRRG